MVSTITSVTGTLTRKRVLSCHFLINLQISNFKFQIRRGFTVIELLVVLGVIGLISVITLYGLSQSNSTQPLDNAQKEFVTALRSVQNQVVNGADGVAVKSLIISPASATSYTIVNSYLASVYSTAVVSLPSGVRFYQVGGVLFTALANSVAICLSNPNLANFGVSQLCVTDATLKRGCTSGQAFACNDGTTPSINTTSPFEIVFSQGTARRKVVLEGAGMRINRIYAP